MKKKSIALLCLMSLIVSGCSSTGASQVKSKNSLTRKFGSAKLNTEFVTKPLTSNKQANNDISISFEPTVSDLNKDPSTPIHISYLKPVVSINGNIDAQYKITESLKEQKSNFDKNITLLKSAFQSKATKDEPIELTQTFESRRSNNNVISFYGESTNSVSNARTVTPLNYDSRTGNKLSLNDIAADITELLNSACSYIYSQLQLPKYSDQLNLLGTDVDAQIRSDILKDGNWCLSNFGLTFYMVDNITDPEISTISDFTIPYYRLAGLKNEYQYTGPFEVAGQCGSSLIADLDGDGYADKVHLDVTYKNSDPKQLIEATSSTFTINGNEFYPEVEQTFLSDMLKDGKFFLLDLDTTDKYIEIGLGYSDYSATDIYRYENNNLTYIGKIDTYLDDSTCNLPGDGTISCSKLGVLAEKSLVSVTYQLNGNKIEEKPQEWYSIIPVTQHTIKSDITVYKEKSQSSETLTLTEKDGPVTFIGQDGTHWVQLKTNYGETYYLYIENLFTMGDGRNTQDVFGDINYAD